jgi:hypothetical protein
MEDCLLIKQFEYNATAINCFKILTNYIYLYTKPHADAWQANKGSHRLINHALCILHRVFHEMTVETQVAIHWVT